MSHAEPHGQVSFDFGIPAWIISSGNGLRQKCGDIFEVEVKCAYVREPTGKPPRDIKHTDVAYLWSVHFPGRKSSANSRELSYKICHIVRNLAHETDPFADSKNRLHKALTTLEVPEDEYYLFEHENRE